MTPLSTLTGQTGRGIRTNGERKPCTSHLNLTRSLADEWGLIPPAQRKPFNPTCDYRLANEAGQFLHMSGTALTADRSYAWQGTYKQMRKVRECLPLAKNLNSIPVV